MAAKFSIPNYFVPKGYPKKYNELGTTDVTEVACFKNVHAILRTCQKTTELDNYIFWSKCSSVNETLEIHTLQFGINLATL